MAGGAGPSPTDRAEEGTRHGPVAPLRRAGGWGQEQPSSLGPSALRGRCRAHQVEPRSCSTEASPTQIHGASAEHCLFV